MIKLNKILNEDKGLNKKDIAYQLSIDYSGNTKPRITKFNKKGVTVFYGYKVNPKDVIKSLNKLEPSIKIKHKGWSNNSSGGGTHTFVFEAKLEKEKFTEPEEMRNEEYIETMDGDGSVEKGLIMIKKSWLNWKKGPLTNYEDVPPAYKELEKYIAKWIKKNLR